MKVWEVTCYSCGKKWEEYSHHDDNPIVVRRHVTTYNKEAQCDCGLPRGNSILDWDGEVVLVEESVESPAKSASR